MESERALTVPDRALSLADMMTLGDVFAKSGFFTDSKQAAQAVVKILAGAELGFPAVVSMTGINVVMGKVSISAGLMAALIKRSKRYDYTVKQLTDSGCVLEFHDNGKPVFTSSYTLEDAKKAGLLGKDMWQKYPRNMLFARSLSNGARICCPELVTGVYTPEELGLAVDGDGNAVIDVTPVIEQPTPVVEQAKPAQPVPATPATPANGTRPYPPEKLQEAFAKIVRMNKDTPMADGIRGLTVAWLELCFAGQNDVKQKRHSLVRYLTGKTSIADCTWAELRAFRMWLKPTQDSGNAFHIDSLAEQEAQQVITRVLLDAGQQELPLAEEPAEDEVDADGLPSLFTGQGGK